MSVSRRALMGLALAAPVLAACGTTEAARTAAPTGSATSGGSIRLTDAAEELQIAGSAAIGAARLFS